MECIQFDSYSILLNFLQENADSNVEEQFEEDVLQLLLQAEAMKQRQQQPTTQQPTTQQPTTQQSNERTEQMSEHSEFKEEKSPEQCPQSRLDVKDGEDG